MSVKSSDRMKHLEQVQEELLDLQWTSRYICWLSCPMAFWAVQRYWPASVNWTYFKVREDTRAWLRTTIFLSRLYKEEEREFSHSNSLTFLYNRINITLIQTVKMSLLCLIISFSRPAQCIPMCHCNSLANPVFYPHLYLWYSTYLLHIIFDWTLDFWQALWLL